MEMTALGTLPPVSSFSGCCAGGLVPISFSKCLCQRCSGDRGDDGWAASGTYASQRDLRVRVMSWLRLKISGEGSVSQA